MGGYPEEGMSLLATVDPVWIRCGCAVGVPKAVYTYSTAHHLDL